MIVSRIPGNQSAADLAQFSGMGEVFEAAAGGMADRIDAFPKFASRQALAKFLARGELFRKILGVAGVVVECGVLHGAGLFTFAKLSSILEPVNHTRRIIGFDTFSGFTGVSDVDRAGNSGLATDGALRGSDIAELERAVALYDANRPLAHIPKIELVAGDIVQTAPAYVAANPHLVVAMLYLDLDLFEPTKAAITAFRPLMPKGAIIVFDELCAKAFPGETLAVRETLGLERLRIERFTYDPYIAYAVLE